MLVHLSILFDFVLQVHFLETIFICGFDAQVSVMSIEAGMCMWDGLKYSAHVDHNEGACQPVANILNNLISILNNFETITSMAQRNTETDQVLVIIAVQLHIV